MIEIGEKKQNISYKKRLAAYSIMVRKTDNKVAIATDKENVYFLLGGGSITGESDIETLKREVIEETGYSLKKIKYFDKIRSWYYSDKYGYVDTQAIIFISEFNKKVTNPIELDHKVLWVSPNEYKDKLYYEYQRYILNEYIRRKSNE